MRKRISPETVRRINRLREKGFSYDAIAKKTGVSLKAVYLMLNQKTKEEIINRNKQIIELRAKGMTHQEIADIVGCHRQTVGSVLQKQEGYVKGQAVDTRNRRKER